MKTNMMNLFKVAVLCVMSLGLANCSKNSDSNTGYSLQYVNGIQQCVQTSTGQIVASNLCAGVNGGYTWQTINGIQQCIQTSTGQVVQSTLCTNAGTGYSTCNGLYSFNSGGQQYQIQCSSSSQLSAQQYYNYYGNSQVYNCRGLTLTSQYGQQVSCQY